MPTMNLVQQVLSPVSANDEKQMPTMMGQSKPRVM